MNTMQKSTIKIVTTSQQVNDAKTGRSPQVHPHMCETFTQSPSDGSGNHVHSSAGQELDTCREEEPLNKFHHLRRSNNSFHLKKTQSMEDLHEGHRPAGANMPELKSSPEKRV